jgi:hypothetical protein
MLKWKLNLVSANDAFSQMHKVKNDFNYAYSFLNLVGIFRAYGVGLGGVLVLFVTRPVLEYRKRSSSHFGLVRDKW